MGVKQSYP